MKKIFLIITLLFNVLMVKTIANTTIYATSISDEISKPLIVKVGDDYQDYLEYENYEIISSNVNFKKCGIYKIIYEHIETAEQIEKTIYVKSEEDLTIQKTYSETYITLTTLRENIDVTNVQKFNNNYYISYTERLEDETYNIGFMKVSNYEIIFDEIIFQKTDGKIVDTIIKDEEIILMVEKANTYSYLDLYYIVMSPKGAITHYYKYEGRGIECGLRLLESTNYYYLVLDTTSKDEGSFSFQHTCQSGVIFVVEKGTNKQCGLYEIVEDNDVDVIDAINIEDELYVVYEMYNSMTNLKEINIAHINTIKQNIETINFSLKLTEYVKKIKVDSSNNIYIATSDYNYELKDYVSKIYELDTSLTKHLINEYQYQKEGTCNLIDISVSNNSNIVAIYSIVKYDSEIEYGYLYQILENGEIIVEFEDFSATSMINGFITTSELLFMNDNVVVIDKINYSIFTNLKETQVKNNQEYFEISFPTLFINGDKIEINLDKSKLNYNLNLYGEYKLYYYFSSSEVDVLTSGVLKVSPYTNVYEDGIFDLNTKILTNGISTLNSMEIESGYEIKKAGSYTLVLKSNNGEEYITNFEVSCLSNNAAKLKEDIPTYEIDTSTYTKTDLIDISNHINEDTLVDKTENNLWLVLIPSCALIGLGIVIFNKR